MNLFQIPIIKYPTKEEIMDHEIKYKEETIKVITLWKKDSWKEAKKGSLREKFESLKLILNKLAEIYEKPVNIEFAPEKPSCCYMPVFRLISINSSCSIISSFHELAHHLFGSNEKRACRWSVWLFKKTFNKAFEKLIWQNHLLIKK